jgi:ParB-like chromosome segregation protein Spo0J
MLDLYRDPQPPWHDQPVNNVRWVPIAKVSPNDYNPNTVAKVEMHLLYTSILHDGYTQPVVTIYDPGTDMYIIVDGFHRYYVMLTHRDIWERTDGHLPLVVIDKPLNDRMASTIRHNRARGKHTIQGMSNMVFALLDGGWTDAEICNELGMNPEELLRLKHITGFSKLFADVEYRKAWMTERQIKIRQNWQESQHAAAVQD